MIAVLRAGGAFVPLDPSHPAERLKSLSASVGASLILCSRNHAQLCSEILGNVLPIDDITMAEDFPTGAHTPHAKLSGRNAAYVIFTSGTTGKPKVAVEPFSSLITPTHMNLWLTHLN